MKTIQLAAMGLVVMGTLKVVEMLTRQSLSFDVDVDGEFMGEIEKDLENCGQ
jgi:hypothetical protein